MCKEIIVKSINISESKKEVKKCNKVVVDYVRSLENVVAMGDETLIKAKNKITQLSLQIKELEEQNEKLEHDLISANWTIDELKEQNENLKCCENCKYWHTCSFTCDIPLCTGWEYDGLKSAEREV